MKLIFKKIFCFLWLITGSTELWSAPTYLCRDSYGQNLYTDKNSDGHCIATNFGKINTYPAVSKKSFIAAGNKKTGAYPPKNTVTVSGRPLVTNTVQMLRDDKRRQVLQEELRRESAAIANAQKKLRALRLNPADSARLREVQQELFDRKHNIDLIEKELSRV